MLLTKQYEVEFKSAGDEEPDGTIIALASVFGTVDLVGDRVIKGAFTKTLRNWRAKGDPIPIILDHQWGDVHSHIGCANPNDVKQTPAGLVGKGILDINDNPVARQVHRLLKRRSLKAFSFGYRVLDEELDEEGVNNLLELDLVEFGPTLKGAHPDAELLEVKSAVEATMVKNTNLRQRTEQAALEVAMGGKREAVRRDRADQPEFIDQVVDGLMGRFAEIGLLTDEQAKSIWSTSYLYDLPDSAFLYVAPGGEKDDGKTTPRSLRFFPVRDKSGDVDQQHVKNALSRIPQSEIPDEAKGKAIIAAQELLKDEPDPDLEAEEPPVATGKRDDALRRRSESIALDLAMGKTPASPPKAPDPVVEDEPEEPAKAAPTPMSPITLVIDTTNGTATTATTQNPTLDPEAFAKAVADRFGNDDEDEEVTDEGKARARALRKATRDVALELAMGATGTKQLASELSKMLQYAGSERWGTDRIYVYVDDYDVDASWVVYCVSNYQDNESRYIKMDYTRDGMGEVTLTGEEIMVERTTDYRAKHHKGPEAPEQLTPAAFAEAVAVELRAKVDEDDEEDEPPKKKGRDPLRKRSDRAALALALGRSPTDVPEIAEPDPPDDDDPPKEKSEPLTPEAFADTFADAVIEKLRIKTDEDKKPEDKKPATATSEGRDPLRKRTDRESLELALGRSPQDVPDLAQPDPEEEEAEVPDEKRLRRQSDRQRLDLALGGFK